MNNIGFKNLTALAALALLACGVQEASAQNNWTLTGSSSANGGYIIVGNSASDLGSLSPGTSPVYLSANGGDTITLDAGNTATGSGISVIDLEKPGNTLNNFGTITNYSAFNAYGVYINGEGNIVNNYGTIDSEAYGVFIYSHSNILNNWSQITSPYNALYVGGNSDTINNHGVLTGGTYGSINYGTDNTYNNYGTITSGDYGVYEAGDFDTYNNFRGATITGGQYGLHMEGDNHYITINNWGMMTSNNTVIDDPNCTNVTVNNYAGATMQGLFILNVEGGSDLTVNNWGTMLAPNDNGLIINDTTQNTFNNWGTISAYYYTLDFDNSTYNTVNNRGAILSTQDGPAVLVEFLGHNVVNNWGTISAPMEDAIVIVSSDSNVVNNWGRISGGYDSVEIGDGNDNTINLNGHSSLGGVISVAGTGNVVNLNFTGLSPAQIASLDAVLKPQGVNSGTATDVTFTLRGVTYNVDPAIVNFHPSSYQLQAQTPNQAAVGASLDSATTNPPPGSPLFNLFNAIDQSGNVPGALAALSPEKYAIYGELAIQNTTGWVQNIDRRLNNLRDGSESIDTTGVGADNTVALTSGYSKDGDSSKESKQIVQPAPQENRWGFFATGNGMFFRGNAHDADLQDGKANSAGTLVGIDGKAGEHAVIGAFGAYDNSAVDLGTDGSHATIESYTGGLYGSYHQDGFYLNSLAAYTRNNYSSNRNIVFPGFFGNEGGSTHSSQYSANIDGGYDFKLTDRLTAGPLAGVQYVHMDMNGFNEVGGVGALGIGEQTMNSLQSRLGGRIDYHLMTQANDSAGFELYAAWQHEYLDDSRAISASFEGSGLTPFSVQTASPKRDAGVVGMSLNFTFKNRLTLFTDYELRMWSASYFEQSVNGGARISF